jgi:hypothetical protein
MAHPALDLLTATYHRAVAGLTEAILVAPYPQWYDHINHLPLPERLTYCVLLFDAQVGNGGLHQYFWNGYGQFGYETVAYLGVLGATTQAGILRQALTVLAEEESEPAMLREKVHTRSMESLNTFAEPLTSALDNLDDAYYACTEDIEERIRTFLTTYGQERLGTGSD